MDDELVRWDGASSELLTTSGAEVRAVQADADGAWLVGDGIQRWDGAALSPSAASDELLVDIDGTDDNLWAVGGTTALYWDGEEWTAHEPPLPLGGVAVYRSDDVWAIADSSTAMPALVHWDGVAWWPLELPPHLESLSYPVLTAIAVAPGGDLWIGGSSEGIDPGDGAFLLHGIRE